MRALLCSLCLISLLFFFFFQAEDGIRDVAVTGVQTCALPISRPPSPLRRRLRSAGEGRKGLGGRAARLRIYPLAAGRGDPRPYQSTRRVEIGRASCRERV